MGRSSINGLVIVGAICFVLGLIGFAVPIFTTQHTTDVAKVGDLKIQTTQNTSHTIPPMVSGGVLLLGVVLIGAGVYRKG